MPSFMGNYVVLKKKKKQIVDIFDSFDSWGILSLHYWRVKKILKKINKKENLTLEEFTHDQIDFESLQDSLKEDEYYILAYLDILEQVHICRKLGK